MSTPTARRRRLGEHVTAYGFLCAALVVFAVFAWYPAVRNIVLSFQEVNFVRGSSWVGLENFRRLLDDPLFATAWRNSALFTLYALLLGFGVPFVTALLINEFRHARAYFRVLVYLPVMLPPVVVALMWRWFYQPEGGLINEVLGTAGLPTPEWTNSSSTALISLVIASTWANLGTATLIYLAALQTIPGELYEAAELDGAGIWRRIWHVTVPQTRFVILMLLLLQVIATMQVFTEPFVMTGGGPEDSTVTVMLLIYRYAFVYNDFGAASAMSLLLLVVLAVFSAAYLRVTRGQQK
ncbi:carbohydrate ABC transporter membrane protein 1, CUT1 family [Streptomyces zhaozhouensis]|uniref:Carbohydrate ABC transporter membrane protein 1, CUT1 family n=1 Tax=Streptomyces zhaozhouensis TaxID=1300267 RepID=A0A286DZX5_9ACTN|nr:sugar ABC transporter permease [Streptomyces zhaozhouensis]SOD64198.1 carbohydrate ABC transporter membrane protein 1, CUT1 family [Streptomyces zhaozhouensis]